MSREKRQGAQWNMGVGLESLMEEGLPGPGPEEQELVAEWRAGEEGNAFWPTVLSKVLMGKGQCVFTELRAAKPT